MIHACGLSLASGSLELTEFVAQVAQRLLHHLDRVAMGTDFFVLACEFSALRLFGLRGRPQTLCDHLAISGETAIPREDEVDLALLDLGP